MADAAHDWRNTESTLNTNTKVIYLMKLEWAGAPAVEVE